MQKNHPKSSALRQTKICMAVAAVVTAAALPGYAAAQTGQKQWQEDRTARLGKIDTDAKTVTPELQKAIATRRFAERMAEQMEAASAVMDSTATWSDKRLALEFVSAAVGSILTETADASISTDGLSKKTALATLKSRIDVAAKAKHAGRAEAYGDLATEINKHATFAKASADAVTPLQRSADLLALKQARVQAAGTEAALTALKNTRQLDAATPNAEKQVARLTWHDKHLTNFMGDEANSDTHAVIGADTTLEITSASGRSSDAIHGVVGGKRDVGTLYVAEGADHDVLVAGTGKELIVHRAIEGAGDLSISVVEGGALTFAAQGENQTGAIYAENVALSATGANGKIQFNEGTSAGSATIALNNGGELVFGTNANAGNSQITVGMAVTQGDVDAALLANPKSRLGVAAAGKLTVSDASAGDATVVNFGLASFDKSKLQNLALLNAGKTTLSNQSEGGKAEVINLGGATLDIADTKLQRMTLTNAGEVTMSGSTVAGEATINLVGGSLDVSAIALPAAEPSDPVVKALTIGSLTGSGEVVAGETTIRLGALHQDDVFDGRILSVKAAVSDSDDVTVRLDTFNKQPLALGDAPLSHQADAISDPPTHLQVVKVGNGNLTLTNDQSAVKRMEIEAGTLTAAHANAMGSGTVSVASAGTVALGADVSGVTDITNAGTIELGTNKLAVRKYASSEGAKINSRVAKQGEDLAFGAIQVSESSDFRATKINVAVDDGIEVADLLKQQVTVVDAPGDADVQIGEVEFGSISTGDGADGNTGGRVTITETSAVNFLGADGGYNANEQAVLASVDGVALGDLALGKIGGSVLSAMALQTAGSEEQRRSARLLSGESLVNNATTAQGSATSFQRGMQTRMIAGGTMFDDKTANGAMAADNGIAGWASFKGGNASQRGDGMSFDVKGLDGAIGIDKRVGQNTLVGASMGLGNQESKAKGMPGESKVNSVSVGLYGSHLSSANWFVNGALSYTNHSVKTDRTVAARNASARLTGKTSGQTFGMFGEVGKRFGVSGVNIDPSVGVRVASTRLNAFDETNRDGQGNDGLKVGSQTQTSTRGVLGVRLWSEVASFAGGKVAPSLRLSYEHEFGNTQSRLTNAIYGAPRDFTVKGPKLGRDIIAADLGVDMQIKKQLEVRVGGNVSVRKGESAMGGGISAKYRF
ncbi:autotransporter domain-containing protein [Pandoraea sp. XJJ-1]|uniref:autotransporter family protein n=1 Tax=Pandoraea sp. XJJ-1 TaxID=3002643 RepID=UPI00227E81A1|nr:autotransporter domain-containing protein [Pandoraea sp. XJJ-1]WAL81549.1 autotransporter domain-containing protein [Pandoraea sp. XJJ-1]